MRKKLFSKYDIKQMSPLECKLFENDKDRSKFIEIVRNYKKRLDFQIYAYNISENNFYKLIIFDNGSDISSIMKIINISYSMYKNNKGRLFGDRYQSHLIKTLNIVKTWIKRYLGLFILWSYKFWELTNDDNINAYKIIKINIMTKM